MSGPVGTRVDRSGVYKLGWVRSRHYVSSVDRPSLEFTVVNHADSRVDRLGQARSRVDRLDLK